MRPESKPIIFDSGFSIIVTPHKEDFVGKIKPVNKPISALNVTEEVEGEGMIEWTFRDEYGVSRVIHTKDFYIISSKVRLFSPQSYFIQEKKKGNNNK